MLTIPAVTLQRKVDVDIPLSNGEVIKAGTLIGFPTLAIQRDEEYYERPLEFDGFRQPMVIVIVTWLTESISDLATAPKHALEGSWQPKLRKSSLQSSWLTTRCGSLPNARASLWIGPSVARSCQALMYMFLSGGEIGDCASRQGRDVVDKVNSLFV
ncbi:hypothetical protein J1614_010411 [Plenodomus biglobosus]|nr:hypothetical protein J1614_010411 [Plenodomus biglobosus]